MKHEEDFRQTVSALRTPFLSVVMPSIKKLNNRWNWENSLIHRLFFPSACCLAIVTILLLRDPCSPSGLAIYRPGAPVPMLHSSHKRTFSIRDARTTFRKRTASFPDKRGQQSFRGFDGRRLL